MRYKYTIRYELKLLGPNVRQATYLQTANRDRAYKAFATLKTQGFKAWLITRL